MSKIQNSPLGQKSYYKNTYTPELLFFIERKKHVIDRAILYGCDVWNAYELSWLNENGMPEVAIAEIIYDCNSKMIVESKSLKLYLNSFNETRFRSINTIISTIQDDLENGICATVHVNIYQPHEWLVFNSARGFLYENSIANSLTITHSKREKNIYYPLCIENIEQNNSFLADYDKMQKDLYLVSNLIRSSCPVTGQPDWASLNIIARKESGFDKKDIETLLQKVYDHIMNERHSKIFHEECVELIYLYIKSVIDIDELTVWARYTRRGGIDINPYRSNIKSFYVDLTKDLRQ